jgi:hypothetical protein
MVKRLSTIMTIIALAGSAAIATAAGTLTEVLQTSRMTVVQVDRAHDRFLCAEHRRWTAVARGDVADIGPGDIVKVDGRAGGRPRLVLLRTAAEELSTVER